ncbi:MAG: OmpA family protein [Ignavibacteria bacterium]|nr:OmpA family protein [Ignavibacteria bacterium]
MSNINSNIINLKLVLIVGIVATLLGCANVKAPPSASDAIPPTGYSPVYVKKNVPLPARKLAGMQAQVTRADVRDPGVVRLYVNVVDSLGNNYTGAATKMWCSVTDTSRTGVRDVKKVVIKEVTARDKLTSAVVLVVDNSGSMGTNRARAVQQAALDLFKVKMPNDAIGVVRYDNNANVEVPLNSDVTALNAALKVNGLEGYGGMTAIHNGVSEAVEHIVQKGSGYDRTAVVAFTDGLENSSTLSRDSVVKRALMTGVAIHCVDFGANVNEGYMQYISNKTGGSYYHMYGTQEFADVFEDVYRRIKNHYVIEISSKVYGNHKVEVKLCWPKDSLLAQTEYNNTPQVGSVSLMNVFFDFNKAMLKKESDDAVESVLAMLNAFPQMSIELRGHTDDKNSTQNPEYNSKLSQKRAEAVRDTLVKKGISTQRITPVGMGASVPIATNEIEDGRAINRRTEFVILNM